MNLSVVKASLVYIESSRKESIVRLSLPPSKKSEQQQKKKTSIFVRRAMIFADTNLDMIEVSFILDFTSIISLLPYIPVYKGFLGLHFEKEKRWVDINVLSDCCVYPFLYTATQQVAVITVSCWAVIWNTMDECVVLCSLGTHQSNLYFE